jgi:D-glycerate 3-kinase
MLILGPMFSGKTSELLRRHERYKIGGKKCVLVKFAMDTRYDATKVATHDQRKQLARDIHPLFQTRGVPGTHDLPLMQKTLTTLLEGKTCPIPRFNKAMDDRYEESNWTACNNPVDFVLFEGWCNHSPYQTDNELEEPVNELEAAEDPDGIWRRYANDQLKEYHEKIFRHADLNIMLKAPDFEKIYEWRSLQEEKLKQKTKKAEQTRIMSAAELKRFIQHYERISRHTLAHLPSTADVVIPVAADHSIKQIITR